MRAGWNPRLDALLRRADPAARVIPEAVVTSAEDVRRREDEWDAAATVGDVETLPSGGAKLRGVVQTHVSQTAHDDWITDLDGLGTHPVARLLWQGATHDADTEVTAIRAWLHPRLDGGQPQEVEWWECRVWALMRYEKLNLNPEIFLSLGRLDGGRARVAAGGGEGEVTFDFAARPLTPANPFYLPERRGVAPERYPVPTTFVEIVALKADGLPAGNVGWAIDSTQTGPTPGNIELAGWEFTDAGTGGFVPDRFEGWYEDASNFQPLPYIVVERSAYTPATLTFDGPAQIDLGAVPPADEAVEFVAQGETPSDSSIVYEVLDDLGTTWIPVRDGQTTDDLAGVSRRQTYDMRVHLTPNTLGDVSPIVRNFGARSIRRWTLDGLARVQPSGWALDPVTLRGEIPQATIEVIRDGSTDYRDFATELLAQRPVADIEFRVWIGSPAVDRADWMMLDLFEVEDYDPQAARILFYCTAPLARLRVARLPKYDETAFPPHREVLVYSNQSLTAVYSDLVQGQAALPERYRGVGVVGADLVGRTIEDSDAKTQADAIAYLAGMAVISSQGTVKAVDVAGAAGIDAVFPAEEIALASARPGLSQAVPEFFVPWDYSDAGGRFRGEVKAFHAPALDAVRTGRLDAPAILDEQIARWIGTQDHATRIGARHVGWFGTGLILLEFRAEYAHPYLEPGDVILVETRQFVARDPNTARALKGVLWALAVVSQVRDPFGREITAWVRSYADLIAAGEAAERIGDTRPEILAAERIVDAEGVVDVTSYGNSQVGFHRAAASLTAFPDEAAVDAEPALAGRVVTFDDLITIAPDEVAFVSVRGYERSDGQGAKSPLLQVIAAHPKTGSPTLQGRVALGANQDTADLFITPESPIPEPLRVHVQDDEAAAAPVWSLVQSGTNAGPRFVASGTEIGPGAWFHDGTQFSQRLDDIALLRDQVRRVRVQAEGQFSALRSTWVPFALDLRYQPWLESVDLVFDEATDELKLTAVGGAHCQSASWQFSDDGFLTIAAVVDAALADDQTVTQALPLLAADRGKEWRARVQPFNGPFVDPNATGLAGVPQEDSVFVPASPGGGIEAPQVEIVFVGTDPNNESLRFQWTDGAGGAGPYEYRWRTSVAGVTGAWQPNPPDGWADIVTQSHDEVVPRDTRHPRRLDLEVRYDVHPELVGRAFHVVEPRDDVPPEDPGDNKWGSGDDGDSRPGRERPKVE